MRKINGTETYIDNDDGTMSLIISGKKNNGVIIFSKCDYERISKHHWYIKDESRGMRYAATKIKEKTVKMHRFILNVHNVNQEISKKEKMIVDHIDRNTFNNTRENLRLVSYSDNNHNHSMNKNNTSGRKGVKFAKPKNRSPKWVAQITVNGKTYRKEFAISVYGDNAKNLACNQRLEWENMFNILSEKFNDYSEKK